VQFEAVTQETTDAINHWNTALNQSAYIDENDFLKAVLPESKQKQLQDEVEHYARQLSGYKATLEDEYKIYGTLSDVANGQTGNKISLQRFVLSVLLDDVLIEASHRLSVMSKGRYLLVRKEERAKGNKASGLELEVEDAYTGKTRPVTSNVTSPPSFANFWATN